MPVEWYTIQHNMRQPHHIRECASIIIIGFIVYKHFRSSKACNAKLIFAYSNIYYTWYGTFGTLNHQLSFINGSTSLGFHFQIHYMQLNSGIFKLKNYPNVDLISRFPNDGRTCPDVG